MRRVQRLVWSWYAGYGVCVPLVLDTLLNYSEKQILNKFCPANQYFTFWIYQNSIIVSEKRERKKINFPSFGMFISFILTSAARWRERSILYHVTRTKQNNVQLILANCSSHKQTISNIHWEILIHSTTQGFKTP